MQAVPAPGDLSHYDGQIEVTDEDIRAAEDAAIDLASFADWLDGTADEVADDGTRFAEYTVGELFAVAFSSGTPIFPSRADACLALRLRYLSAQSARVDALLSAELHQRSADRLLETTRTLVDQADRSLDMRPEFRAAISDASFAVRERRGAA